MAMNGFIVQSVVLLYLPLTLNTPNQIKDDELVFTIGQDREDPDSFRLLALE